MTRNSKLHANCIHSQCQSSDIGVACARSCMTSSGIPLHLHRGFFPTISTMVELNLMLMKVTNQIRAWQNIYIHSSRPPPKATFSPLLAVSSWHLLALHSITFLFPFYSSVLEGSSMLSLKGVPVAGSQSVFKSHRWIFDRCTMSDCFPLPGSICEVCRTSCAANQGYLQSWWVIGVRTSRQHKWGSLLLNQEAAASGNMHRPPFK